MDSDAHSLSLLSMPMGLDYEVIGFDMEVQPLVSPQCNLTFMHERYLHRCRKQSFAICACAMSAVGKYVVSFHKLFAYRVVSPVGIDVVSSHMKNCRIAYGITR